MKKFINMSLVLALATIFTLCFTACSKDDDEAMPAKPILTLTEIGHENSKVGHPGRDFHLEGTILAEGLTKAIYVEIHQENGGSFKIEKDFTQGKYIGVRNADFHEHIDIPETAPLGEYHLHFTVVDQKGQQTTVESDVNLTEDDGTDAEEEEEEHEHHHESSRSAI